MPHIKSAVERFSVWLYAECGFTVEFTEEHLNDYWYYQLGRDTKLDSKRRELLNVRLVLKQRGKEWKIPESEEIYRDIAEEEADPGFRDWYRDKQHLWTSTRPQTERNSPREKLRSGERTSLNGLKSRRTNSLMRTGRPKVGRFQALCTCRATLVYAPVR